MSRESVTRETVEKVKAYLSNNKYAVLTQNELALIAGVSPSTISRVSSGYYDHLLTPEPPVANTEDVAVAIDYQTLKHLIACENAIEKILANARVSTGYDNTLFIDYRVLFGVLRAYVLDDVENRLNELREEENNE